MAITLSKTGVTSVTFPRGRIFPTDVLEDVNQLIEQAEDKTPQVTELGPTLRHWDVELLSVDDATEAAFRAFMEHANVRWALSTFTLMDETNTAYMVRYWGPFPLRRTQYGGGLWRLKFTVLKEP